MGAIESLSADDQIESFYVGYFDRAADSQGYLYWQQQYLHDLSSGLTESQALLSIANLFAPQSETQTNYPQMSQILAFQDHPTYGPSGPPTTIVSAVDGFITAVYENLFNRAPDAGGELYWAGQILGWNFTTNSPQAISPIGDIIIQIENGAQTTDITTLDNKIDVADYFTQEGASASLGFQPLSKSYLAEASSVVLNTTDASSGPGSVPYGEAAVQAYIAAQSTGNTYTLTIGQDTLPGPSGPPATGHDTFNAPLVPPAGGQTVEQPTLTNFDSLVDTFFQGVPSSVLNASFDGSATASGLNIVNIPTWYIQNIDEGYAHYTGSTIFNPDGFSWFYGTVTLTGDGPSGPSNINGLTTLNYNANSGGDSLIIGDNAEPIQTGNNGNANGFAINVSNALGNGYNGVDVDIWAGDFPTGGSTITVDAEAVGGFQEYNGSYLVPPPILGTYGDPDDYDPNWVGYGEHAYAIAAGASAGPDGPVGFTTWVVKSTAATAIGSLNIIALGGEGSTSATTLTLQDDGSNTMLYATYLSDSLLSDWENLTTINLVNTSGFVTLTGAETTAQEGSSSYFYRFGGLLTDTGTTGTASETAGLSILGGGGNSFYDLSGMNLTAAGYAATSIDGGHSIKGNSEVAFNNSVVANATAVNPSGTTVNISHIQILDDTGNPNSANEQGGWINMNDFPGLAPLNVDYALIAEDNATTPTGQPVVPPGLPFTSTASPPSVSDNGIIPAGYQVLQLLDNEGSTAVTQGADLFIYNGPTQFAINAQDMANGWWTDGSQPEATPITYTDDTTVTTYVLNTPLYVNGYNLTIQGEYPVPSVNTTDTLKYYISDDGVTFTGYKEGAVYSLVDQSGFSPVTLFTLSDTPVVQILNYTNVDFYLPYESLSPSNASSSTDGGSPYPNWVVLGSTSFTDAPVVLSFANGHFQNASLNFYDNANDTGGSDPGGPDNLALGDTNFAINPGEAPLSIASIGVDTVQVDANAITTTIHDYGAGVFEIGATDATTLIATSTSHLIQDVSATLDYFTANDLTAPEGITVTGSAVGQNLLQGTSGLVSDTGSGGSTTVGIGGIGGGNAVIGSTLGDVLVAGIQHGGENGGWGNDTLTGGAGDNGVTFLETGGVLGTYDGNSGDNFFPEGGVDTVNIGGLNSSGAAIGASNATTWFGAYDVSNSGDYLGVLENSGVGHIYGQAITTVVGGVESYVDGYGGGNLVTINGFEPYVGSSLTRGDIINLDAPDWAKGALNGGLTDQGLANALGASISGLHNADATTAEVGNTTGNVVTVLGANLILDSFGPYANSNQLVAGLESAGAFTLQAIAGHSVEHLLVAFQNTTGGVNIDDLTLTNTGGAKILPSTASLDPTATDLITLNGVNITGVELSQLQTGHNFHFV